MIIFYILLFISLYVTLSSMLGFIEALDGQKNKESKKKRFI